MLVAVPASVVVVGSIFIDSLYRRPEDAEHRVNAIFTSIGGVARNIAENLGWLGRAPRFVTLSSPSEEAGVVAEGLRRAGVELVAKLVDGGIGSYLGVQAPSGEVTQYGFEHPPSEQLDWTFVRAALEPAGHVVFESGVNPDMIDELLEFCRARGLFSCGVPTCPDLHRPASLLGVSCLILNRSEAAALLDRATLTREHAPAAAEALVRRGPREVVITLDAEGVVAAEHGRAPELFAPPPSDRIVNTSGCGDAFVAGYVAARSVGADVRVAVGVGLERARVTMRVMSAVLPEPTRLDKLVALSR